MSAGRGADAAGHHITHQIVFILWITLLVVLTHVMSPKALG
jgi:hypothetical protein